MGFCSAGIFPHNQVLQLSPQDYPLGVFPLTTTINRRGVWRLAHANLSACSPDHSSPSGLCSGCESVPWEDFYIRNPTADSLLSFFASPGYCPLSMATLRATCSLMRFSCLTTLEKPSKLSKPRIEKPGALQRLNHQVWDPTLTSEISPPEVLRPSSTINPNDANLPTQCASGQIARSSLGARFRAPRTS
jgi:hypothetical protein